ncbi:diguanylate cyclase domain-containing protein [Demequina sp.]|uniref:GGDEF domain-containing protein n=1 Tax=Demequina sp. TaxID=2050685 RepID=UPI003D100C94
MVTRAHVWLRTTWAQLARLGTDTPRADDARAVASANRVYALAIVANLPWLVVLPIIGGPTPAPVVTHFVMMLTWAAGLWLNRLRMPLLASVLALLAPLMQYAYLTDVYSRGAAFQLHLLAVPALSFAMFPARRWGIRLGIGLIGAATLFAIYVVPTFDEPYAEIPTRTIHALAIANVVSVLGLLYTIAAFNSFFYQRERKRNEVLLTEARAAAQTDSLTESLNRRGITPVIAAAARQGQYSLALVDLDRFKRINDALGHGAGDVVLANVARTIARSVGDAGTVARWGGEEFLVVIPQTSLKQAIAILDRMRAEVEDEYAMEGIQQPVTISAGVAHGRQLAPKDELLRLADANLYEAKASGRNVVVGSDLQEGVRD